MAKSVLPRAVRALTQELTRLPGIGPKSARRLAVYLRQQPAATVVRLREALRGLQEQVGVCRDCFYLAEGEQCIICRDISRRRDILCVVASPLDVEAIEKTAAYNGLYHVLGGVLSPLEGIDAEQLTLQELKARTEAASVKELIMALNQTLEGEATARYIKQQMAREGLKITRLGRGLPTGGDIEFADTMTLLSAFEGRKQL